MMKASALLACLCFASATHAAVLIIEVTGTAEVKGKGPAYALAELSNDSRLSLSQGATIRAIDVSTGQEYVMHGAGNYIVGQGGPKALSGRLVKLDEKPPGHANLRISTDRAALGSMVMRSGSSNNAIRDARPTDNRNNQLRNEPGVPREIATNSGDYQKPLDPVLTLDRDVSMANNELQEAELQFDPEHPIVATKLMKLAEALRLLGADSDAIVLGQRALGIREKALGPNNEDYVSTLNFLVPLYRDNGMTEKAEAMAFRSVELAEAIHGRGHLKTLNALANLATLYGTKGKFDQGKSLLERAIAIADHGFGLEHPESAVYRQNLANMLRLNGQYRDAEAMYLKVLAIREAAFGLKHIALASTYMNLGVLYAQQRRFTEAAGAFSLSTQIIETNLGPFHPRLISSLTNLAGAYLEQGKIEQAEAPLLQARRISDAEGGTPRAMIGIFANLSALYVRTSRPTEALTYSRLATSIMQKVTIDGGDATLVGWDTSLHLEILQSIQAIDNSVPALSEGFETAQLEQLTGTGNAVLGMAARFASGNDAIAQVIRQRQDLVASRSRLEQILTRALSAPGGERDAASESALRARIASEVSHVAKLDQQLAEQFPEFNELIRTDPLPVGQAQKYLGPSEALVMYSFHEKSSWAWVIQKSRAAWIRLSATTSDVSRHVEAIRRSMEHPESATKIASTELNGLAKAILDPLKPELRGVKHLVVIPAGALKSLPISMLPMKPIGRIRTNADFRKVDWLARHYSVSIVPSVRSLKAIRHGVRNTTAGQQPFIGFGDPMFVDSATSQQSRRGSEARTRALAKVDEIRKQKPLPETADELLSIAKILKASPDSVWTQAWATEQAVKEVDLSRYGTVVFSTHGVLAGEMPGIIEPGLILTPPDVASEDEDGYLAASEVAKLRLNANWVILAACNTGASDGATGADGLSGLAKAFFYAGGRTLLVSHWPVVSSATVKLTTETLRNYHDKPSMGKAEAHRTAMLSMLNDRRNPEYASPRYWAPFVVVGEGAN